MTRYSARGDLHTRQRGEGEEENKDECEEFFHGESVVSIVGENVFVA